MARNPGTSGGPAPCPSRHAGPAHIRPGLAEALSRLLGTAGLAVVDIPAMPGQRDHRTGEVGAVAGPLAQSLPDLLVARERTMALRKSYRDMLRQQLEAVIAQLEFRDEPLRREFLRCRWLDQVLWLEGAALRNQRWHATLRLLTIGAGVIIPALVTLDVGGDAAPYARWATVLLGLVVAAGTALEGAFRFGERWRHYRRIAELLKSEGWDFLQLSGRYAAYPTRDGAYRAFAGQVERISRQDIDRYISEVVAGQGAERTAEPGAPRAPGDDGRPAGGSPADTAADELGLAASRAAGGQVPRDQGEPIRPAPR
jgi:hypothetical protein